MAGIRDSKKLYWGLIITFFVLYALVGFVSTLHSITFFHLANTMWMAVLLGITYEIGQASVLFSILMSKNSQKMLPWLLMILLTALQVTANVYASFKFMDSSGSMDWTYWQRSILFWMETSDPEMFKVVISWITGALLPIVALGMTALVAENLKLKDEEDEPNPIQPTDPFDKGSIKAGKVYDEPTNMEDRSEKIQFNDGLDDLDIDSKELLDIQEKMSKEPKDPSIDIPDKNTRLQLLAEELLKPENELKFPEGIKTPGTPGETEIIKKPIEFNLQDNDIIIDNDEDIDHFWEEKEESKQSEEFNTDPNTGLFPKKPINNKRGWHLNKEFEDENGDIYHYGTFQYNKKDKPKEEEPKKA